MRTRLFTLLFVLCLAVSTAFADPGTPRQRAEDASARILALLKDPAFKAPDTKPAIRQKIEDEVLSLFDFEEFSTRTVGARWKQFSPEQKKAFIAAFTDLLRNTYIDTLDSYSGQSIAYTGELSSDNGTRVEVQMNFKGETDHPVAFRMLVKNDKWVVYDVIIEGISMIRNYREQFRDILAKGTPDSLIDMVRKKAQEQKLQPTPQRAGK